MLRDWLGRFAELHERYGPVIRRGPKPRSTAASFGRLGTDVLGGFATTLGERIAGSPAVVPDPQLAALALVAMIERCNYYAITGQIDGGRTTLADTLTEIAFASLFGATPHRKMTPVSGSRRARR